MSSGTGKGRTSFNDSVGNAENQRLGLQDDMSSNCLRKEEDVLVLSEAEDDVMLIRRTSSSGARTLTALNQTSRQLESILNDINRETLRTQRMSAFHMNGHDSFDTSDEDVGYESELRAELDSFHLPPVPKYLQGNANPMPDGSEVIHANGASQDDESSSTRTSPQEAENPLQVDDDSSTSTSSTSHVHNSAQNVSKPQADPNARSSSLGTLHALVKPAKQNECSSKDQRTRHEDAWTTENLEHTPTAVPVAEQMEEGKKLNSAMIVLLAKLLVVVGSIGILVGVAMVILPRGGDSGEHSVNGAYSNDMPPPLGEVDDHAQLDDLWVIKNNATTAIFRTPTAAPISIDLDGSLGGFNGTSDIETKDDEEKVDTPLQSDLTKVQDRASAYPTPCPTSSQRPHPTVHGIPDGSEWYSDSFTEMDHELPPISGGDAIDESTPSPAHDPTHLPTHPPSSVADMDPTNILPSASQSYEEDGGKLPKKASQRRRRALLRGHS